MGRIRSTRSVRPRTTEPTGAVGRVVWFVNQYAGSRRHGMEFRHYELGRQLASRGWTVIVVSGSFSHLFHEPPETRGTYSIRDVDGLTYCWVRVPEYARSTSIARVINMVVFMLRLYRLPVSRLPRPDAIVVSSPSLFPILPAARWARRLRSRLVFEVRDIWPLSLQEVAGMSVNHPLIALMRWFEQYAYRRADAVVTVLPAAGPYLQANGAVPDCISVIPNGVSSEVIDAVAGPPPNAVTEAVRDHAFNVGFVGTLGAANALDALIGAAHLLAAEDIGFVIVGQGTDAERLHLLAAGLTSVVFVGSVAKADVPAALRTFDACYVGYHRSDLYRFGISPNKVFDYMAAARPVVLAASAANDPVAEAGCGLTVEPDDPAAVAHAILALRAMPDADRKRLGLNGRIYVERAHSYAVLAEAYERVLEADPR